MTKENSSRLDCHIMARKMPSAQVSIALRNRWRQNAVTLRILRQEVSPKKHTNELGQTGLWVNGDCASFSKLG